MIIPCAHESLPCTNRNKYTGTQFLYVSWNMFDMCLPQKKQTNKNNLVTFPTDQRVTLWQHLLSERWAVGQQHWSRLFLCDSNGLHSVRPEKRSLCFTHVLRSWGGILQVSHKHFILLRLGSFSRSLNKYPFYCWILYFGGTFLLYFKENGVWSRGPKMRTTHTYRQDGGSVPWGACFCKGGNVLKVKKKKCNKTFKNV